MAAPTFNRERAAAALVEAAFLGDTRSAKRFQVDVRTIRRWRKRVDSDPELSAFVLEKLRTAEKNWGERLSRAKISATEFISEAAQVGNPRDPDMLKAMSDALGILMEAEFARDLLNARIVQQGTAHRAATEPMVADTGPATQETNNALSGEGQGEGIDAE